MYTHIEEYVTSLYQYLSITSPEEIDIDSIAAKLGLNIFYGSASFIINNNLFIQKSTKQKEWQTFGHEICHYLRHCGNQLNMGKLFVNFQEYQANYFAYHFCVPTFMLDNLKELTVYMIMDLFNVEYKFALRRLEMYQSKVIMQQTIA